jgi:hypothetical protein
MKCTNHPEKDAVAVCRACGRGICGECCAFVQDTAACTNRCETRVDAMVALQARNDRVQASFEAGQITDESLLLYRTNEKGAWAWLVFLLILATYLIYKFVQSLSLPDVSILSLWLLAIVAMGIYGAIGSVLKWKRLLKQRREINTMWRSR